MTFCVSLLESWWGFWRGFWCGFWNIPRMPFGFTSFFWPVFLSGSVCTASISISISWFTFSCSFLIERNVPIISSSFGSIYSSFNSDWYRTRRWWLMILPTIVIFISQGTSSPPWTRGLLLQCLPRILTATCAPLSMVNFVIQLISIGKCPTISAGESGLNTLIKNESYGLFFFMGKFQ